MGRRIDGRITHGKLPRAIEGDDRLAEGDVGHFLRRLNLTQGQGDRNKPRRESETFPVETSDASNIPKRHLDCGLGEAVQRLMLVWYSR